MLNREIDDLELKMLEAGEPTVLSEAEKVEGLIKRLCRVEAETSKMIEAASLINEQYSLRIQKLEKMRTHDENMRKRNQDEAAEQALKRGGPYIFNRWRNWEGTPFDMSDVCAAICEALTQNGVIAWNGDGVSIVAQMVEAGHRRAEKAEKERDEFKALNRASPVEASEDSYVAARDKRLRARDAIQDDEDLKYARKNLFNALKVPKTLLGTSKKSKVPSKSRPRGRKPKAKR